MLTANELAETRTMDLQNKEFLTNYNVSMDCNHISLLQLVSISPFGCLTGSRPPTR